MGIEFKKRVETSKFLDPTNNFTEKSFPIEFRYDPLTKDMGLVIEFRRRGEEKTDLSEVIARSLQMGCPFCPESIEKVTPKFIPSLCSEGRIKIGEAVVFPNTMPYMSYSAVTVISSRHFLNLPEFTEDMLADAFLASQTYLRRVQEYDANAKYWLITWNCMPPANSSQVHPHLQVFAAPLPLAHHQVLLDASKKYRNESGTNYWSDFIAEERRLQERYIATIGNIVWLTSFVPRSLQLDVQAVFQDRKSLLSLSREDIESFCQGLTKIFKYMDDQNFYSFNLCFYSGVSGEDSFWTQAKLVQRGSHTPLHISDVGNIQLLLDTQLCIKYPEEVCQELKAYFAQQGKNKEE